MLSHTATTTKTVLFCILCLTACCCELLGAQEVQPLPVEAALGARSFAELSTVEFSPDGKWLAYVVKAGSRNNPADVSSEVRTGIPMWVNGYDIWISNVETGVARNLTGHRGESWLPKWSPDGCCLAFLSDRDGSGQARLWVWNIASDAFGRLSDRNIRADQMEWTPDGRKILTTTVPDGLSIQNYVEIVEAVPTEGRVEESVQGATVQVLKSAPAPEKGADAVHSDPWTLNYSLRDLVAFDARTGAADLVVHGQRIESFALSPDTSQIAYTASKRFDRPGSQQILFDLATVNLTTKQTKIVASDLRLAYGAADFSWSPDGTLLAYYTLGTDDFDCHVVNVANGAKRNITNFRAPRSIPRRSSLPLWDRQNHVYLLLDGELWVASPDQERARKLADIKGRRIVELVGQKENLLWTGDGDKSMVVVTHDTAGKQDGFYKVDLASGAYIRLMEQGQCYLCGNQRRSMTVTPDGNEVAYLAEDAQHDADLWLSNFSFEHRLRLTTLNPQFDRYMLGSARLIDWLSDDGERLSGALLLPSHYEEGKRYPLVVWVYAGGMLSDNFSHFGLGYRGPFNFQLLATQGYAVFLPDSPQHEGTAMLDLLKTVLPGVSKVVDLGIADPKRIGVMGQSNGGYSTLALISLTKRFRCAIEMHGMGDLIANYGQMEKNGTAFATSNLEHGQNAMGGPPWEFPQRYVQNSPIFFLDKIDTPLLIVHGSADTRVAPFLGDEVFVGLRRLGKEVEYARYQGEDHSPLYWSYANQRDLCHRMITWLDKHLAAGSP